MDEVKQTVVQETVQTKKERNYLFDNIKAILVFSVVLGHFFKVNGDFSVASPGGVIYVIAFCYIMQGFLFISGFFSKKVDKCRKRAFEMFLFPFLILMPIMYWARLLIHGNATLDWLVPSMALWYLLVMFYYRFFMKTLSKIPGILPISVIVSLAAGCLWVFGPTLALGRTLGFLPFFILGYVFKQEWIDKMMSLPKAIYWILLLALIGVSVGIAYGGWIPVPMLYMKSCYASCGLGIVEGLIGRLAIFVIALGWILVFFGLTPKKYSFLSVIGANTLSVYILHIPVRYTIEEFGLPGAGTPWIYLVTVAAAILTTWVLSRPAVAKAYNGAMAWLYKVFCLIISPITKRIHPVKQD